MIYIYIYRLYDIHDVYIYIYDMIYYVYLCMVYDFKSPISILYILQKSLIFPANETSIQFVDFQGSMLYLLFDCQPGMNKPLMYEQVWYAFS